MSDVKKTIMFDQTLGQNNNKTKKKKEKKIKHKPFIKPNTLKNTLGIYHMTTNLLFKFYVY